MSRFQLIVFYLTIMLSSVLEYFSKVLDILLRLPPLFLMDLILKSRYSATFDPTAFFLFVVNYVADIFRNNKSPAEQETEFVLHVAFGFFHLLGFVFIVYSFLLSTKQLLSVYLSAASVAVIFWSCVMNIEYVKYCINLTAKGSSLQRELYSMDRTAVQMFLENYFAQAFWAIIFCFSSTSLSYFPPKKLIAGISFIFPTLISIISLPKDILHNIPILAAAIEISFLAHYVLMHRITIFMHVVSPIRNILLLIDAYGFLFFLVHQFKIFNITQVFKAFWYIRTLKQMMVLLHDAAFSELKRTGVFTVTTESFVSIVQEVLTQSCDTFLAIIGLTYVLTSLIVFVVTHMESLLSIPSNVHQNLSHVVSVVFVTLAMQTGLTVLEPKERLLRVYRNIILIFAAVSYSVHNDLHSALCTVSASGNASLSKHIRVLSGGVLLILYSSCFFIFLVSKHTFSAWFLAASAFNIEVIIKVIVSFIVYTLNIIDARCSTIWENFDDYMFWATSAGHITNFLFNLFLFCNACYILVYESAGVTRVILMMIHLYCNVWSQARSGLIVFNKRKSVAKIVKSLHVATPEQLRVFDDVCSVCYQPLQRAHITSCNHFFHSICLRKWLYEQNTCPFCHKHISLSRDHEHQD